jgi:uncharacterized protein (DUF427 family)
MKAMINGAVVAEATAGDIISIEGNSYFPPASLADGLLAESDTPYTCPWKGPAQYWNLRTPEGAVADGAWSYPVPNPSAIERVGRDFSGYVAFDPGSVTLGDLAGGGRSLCRPPPGLARRPLARDHWPDALSARSGAKCAFWGLWCG